MDDRFYLGRAFDLKQAKRKKEVVNYEPADLTTHAVVTGMTGSGKTGLCVALLEEAALEGIPALVIDPKGDLTNLLLHFPDLAAGDFQPWLDAEQARRRGETLEEAAARTASRWQKGLSEWDIPAQSVRELGERVQFAVYTPGSDAGL